MSETEVKTPEERIARAEELDKAATPGPWKHCGCGRCGLLWSNSDFNIGHADMQNDSGAICEAERQANARFIAESRTLLPALAADAKRAREEADKALAERNEFRDASGLLVGGDPEGVTPEILQKFIMRQDAFIRAWHKCARGWRASHLQESFKLGRAAGARERMQHERNQAIERAEKAEQERDRLKAWLREFEAVLGQEVSELLKKRALPAAPTEG